ncbi:MAG: ComEC/Rec2 family competence protein [Spirosomataceae bacterium]
MIYSVSFQLSYSALSGIIFLQPVLYQSLTFKDWFTDKLWAITAVAITAQLATFPIGAYYFHQFPTYFWLVNPLVVALSCAMLPVALAAIAFSFVPFLADLLGWALTGITWLLNEVVVWTQQLPNAVLGGLSLSSLELVLIYVMIGLVIALLYYRDIRLGWAIASATLVLLAIQVVEIRESKTQKHIVIHAIPRQTAITLMQGNHAFLVADSSFFQPDKKPYNFYLQNFYIERNINHVTQESLQSPSDTLGLVKSLPFGKLIVWQGKKLLLVEKALNNALPPVADLVLIRNTAFREVEKIKQVFGEQKLIFDNSTKFYVLDTLQKQAEANQLPWYFLHKQKVFVAELF